MEPIPTIEENPKGLYGKYYIQKIEGYDSNGDAILSELPDSFEAFVLRLDNECKDKIHLDACKKAVIFYAKEIASHLPELSRDLINRYDNNNNG